MLIVDLHKPRNAFAVWYLKQRKYVDYYMI